MTLSKNILAMMIAMILLSVTSCGGDKDEEVINYAKDIEGVYKGTLNFGGFPIENDVVIKMDYKNDNTVALVLNQTINDIPNIGTFPLNVSCDCEVSFSGSRYNIFCNTEVRIPIAPSTGFPDIIVPTSIDGYITKEYRANIDINVEFAGSQIAVIFIGQKQ